MISIRMGGDSTTVVKASRDVASQSRVLADLIDAFGSDQVIVLEQAEFGTWHLLRFVQLAENSLSFASTTTSAQKVFVDTTRHQSLASQYADFGIVCGKPSNGLKPFEVAFLSRLSLIQVASLAVFADFIEFPYMKDLCCMHLAEQVKAKTTAELQNMFT